MQLNINPASTARHRIYHPQRRYRFPITRKNVSGGGALGPSGRLADYPLIDFHATSSENVQLEQRVTCPTHACLPRGHSRRLSSLGIAGESVVFPGTVPSAGDGCMDKVTRVIAPQSRHHCNSDKGVDLLPYCIVFHFSPNVMIEAKCIR